MIEELNSSKDQLLPDSNQGPAVARLIKTLSKAKSLLEVTEVMNKESKNIIETFKWQKVDE